MPVRATESEAHRWRTFTWSHWVPNKGVDELLGITAKEPYLSAEDYEREKAKSTWEMASTICRTGMRP
jgi:hypothetical protein